MKKIYSFTAFLCFFLFQGFAQLGNYQFTETSGTYTPISGTSTNVSGDSDYGTISLPFDFLYDGGIYDEAQVSTNGWLALGTNETSSQTSNNLASSSRLAFIAPLWDDLNVVASNSSDITYTTVGTAPNRVFIVQWKDVNWNYSAISGTPQNFQVYLYEYGGKIEFHYGTMNTPNSPSASIGITGGIKSAGQFISVTPGSPATTSTVTANNSISSSADLPSGTVYGFVPEGITTADLAVSLIQPYEIGCYSSNQQVEVLLSNFGDTIDFSAQTANLVVEITGQNPQTLSQNLTSGALNSYTSQSVTVSSTYDMSAVGTYNIRAYLTLTSDVDQSNDTTAVRAINNDANASLPLSLDFSGFTGSNLNTVAPGFNEATGTTPNGTTSTWTNQSGLGGSGNITARINLYTTSRQEWILGPKFVPQAGDSLKYKVAVTDWNSVVNSDVMGSDDMLRIMASNDCGASWSAIDTIDAQDNLTTTLTERKLDLTSYASQPLQIGFLATDGPIDNSQDYDLHLDDIFVGSIPLDVSITLDSNVSCNGLLDGGATASATGGAMPYTYTWSNATTTASITGITAGTYTVTVTDNSGTTDIAPITITEPATLVASVTLDSNASCNGLSDGGATASAIGGTMPYTYTWSNAATTASITGVMAGTYTVTISDNNGCTDTESNVITEPATLFASIMLDSNASCNGLSDGGATASATGGTMPYTYLWSNTATTASITGVMAGTYTVTISDNNGCTDTESNVITEPATLVVSITLDSNASCNGGSDGGATASATGGAMPYTYTWSNAATTASITGVMAGAYTVTITDNNGCTDTENGVVTEPAALIVNVVVDSNVSVNGGADGGATASGTGGTMPYTYTWSNAATTASITGVMAGTYSVTLSDNNGCTASNSITVTEPAGPLSNLVITEIMYNPPESGTDSLEYIEIYNNGSAAVDLDGYSFGQGVSYTFGSSMINPGQFIIVAVDSAAYRNVFGVDADFIWTSGGLSNSGEDITILDDFGRLVDSVDFDDANPWPLGPPSPDGDGPSLELIDANLDNNLASNWQISQSLVTGQVINGRQLYGSPKSVVLSVSVQLDSMVSCNGLSDGGATVIANGGVTPYTYNWTGPSGNLNSISSGNFSVTGLSAGSYFITVTDNAGATELDTAVITEPAILTSTMSDTACDSYTWMLNGQTYNMTGSYVDTVASVSGCDSIVTLNLQINSTTFDTLSVLVCDTNFYDWRGDRFMMNGFYNDTIANAAGCDSVLTLDLTFGAPTDTIISDTGCVSYTWAVNGMTYDTSGVYVDTITNVSGCDSIITLNLTIGEEITTNLVDSACESYQWSLNGNTYTSSGIYMDTLATSLGCDSIFILDLLIKEGYDTVLTVSSCDNYVWEYHDSTMYTMSGIYSDTLTKANGCDSVITLNLTINNSTQDTTSQFACDSYLWSENNATYTSSGIYDVTYTNRFGCDSTLSLDLTIRDVDPTVINTGDSIFAVEAGISYQWLDCDNGDIPIPGATSKGFKPDTTGNFKVALMTSSGCVDTSDCNLVQFIGLDENNVNKNQFRMYPNPTTNTFTLELNKSASLDGRVEVMNMSGSVVREVRVLNYKQQIDVTGLSEGVYLIRYYNYYQKLMITD